MYQFYSPIVTRKLKVLDCAEENDNHENVIARYKLEDDKLKNRDFVRIEITPKDGNIFNHKISNWKYEEDEKKTLPDWYIRNKTAIKKKCYAKLKKVFKEQFLIGGEYEEINRNIRFVKDVKIRILKSKVGEMWDSSQVDEMRGSSQVDEMWNSSQVGEMWNSSRVGEMWNSSRVGKMWNSSQVGKMRGSSQVDEMWNSSQVGEMWNSSRVGKMRGSSQVGKMWDSSQVDEMRGYNTINIWSKNAKIKKRSGGNTIVIRRYLKKVKVSIK